MSKQETIEEAGSYQQELFNYLHDLGVIALQGEMHDIERIVLSMQQQNKNLYSEEEVNYLINLLKSTTEYEVLQSFRDKVEQLSEETAKSLLS